MHDEAKLVRTPKVAWEKYRLARDLVQHLRSSWISYPYILMVENAAGGAILWMESPMAGCKMVPLSRPCKVEQTFPDNIWEDNTVSKKLLCWIKYKVKLELRKRPKFESRYHKMIELWVHDWQRNWSWSVWSKNQAWTGNGFLSIFQA